MMIEGFLRCVLDAKSRITYDNTNEDTTLSKAQGVSLQITSGARVSREIDWSKTCKLTKEEFTQFLSLYHIPYKYHDMLPKPNQTIFDAPEGWDKKSFRNKLPDNIHKNPFFQRLGRYLTSVHVFPGPILFKAGLKPSWEHGQQRPMIIVGGPEMLFRNFMYAENDDDLSFIPKEPSANFGIGSPYVSINTEPPVVEVVPIDQPAENTADSEHSPHREEYVIHPGSVPARIRERKCRTRGGSLKPLVKCMLVQGAPTSRSTRAKVAALKDDSSFLTIFDDDEENANACHLKVSAITPLAWKNHLDSQLDVEYEEFKAKCKAAMTDFDKNPAVNVLHGKITSLSREVKEHRVNLDRMLPESQKWSGYQLDRAEVVSKVMPYVAMELVNSDDMGKLVAKLVSASILYGQFHPFEKVVNIIEPFDITKVKGYRSSYKQEHTRAGNELATATFPFLTDVVADPHASVEALLSKKPRVLQRPASTRTHVLASSVPSQKATPSPALMSPPSQITPVATSVSKT
ncbi:hypothetical protein Tco_1302115 [Tanacetum coccineum]